MAQGRRAAGPAERGQRAIGHVPLCRPHGLSRGIKPRVTVEFLCFVKKEHNIMKLKLEHLLQQRGLPRTNVVSALSAQRLLA